MSDIPSIPALGERVPFEPELMAHITAVWGVDFEGARHLYGGEESAIWLAQRGQTPIVVRLSPAWRTTRELDWVYDTVSRLAHHLPVVPRPLRPEPGRESVSGWVMRQADRLVSVHHWIAGNIEPVTGTDRLTKVATLLADAHRALDALGPVPLRPDHQPWEVPATDFDPANVIQLKDAELDEWLVALPERYPDKCLIHGDVYWRNVLWEDEAITGLIDWDELHHGIREQELAWTLWEFCKDASGTMIESEASRTFLMTYQRRGGSFGLEFADEAACFIRRRLRQEYRQALREPGLVERDPYYAAELIAFQRLSGFRLTL